MSTCNRLDLETLKFQPVNMLKVSPDIVMDPNKTWPAH